MKNKAKKQSKKKLLKLNEIAEEHFRLLSPTPRNQYRKGNNIKGVYIHNYKELGYTLEAIINVCIIALDGYEHNEKRNIKEAYKQFADVLEFTKNLIPHEEFEFLDKSRKLLLENNRNTR